MSALRKSFYILKLVTAMLMITFQPAFCQTDKNIKPDETPGGQHVTGGGGIKPQTVFTGPFGCPSSTYNGDFLNGETTLNSVHNVTSELAAVTSFGSMGPGKYLIWHEDDNSANETCMFVYPDVTTTAGTPVTVWKQTGIHTKFNQFAVSFRVPDYVSTDAEHTPHIRLILNGTAQTDIVPSDNAWHRTGTYNISSSTHIIDIEIQVLGVITSGVNSKFEIKNIALTTGGYELDNNYDISSDWCVPTFAPAMIYVSFPDEAENGSLFKTYAVYAGHTGGSPLATGNKVIAVPQTAMVASTVWPTTLYLGLSPEFEALGCNPPAPFGTLRQSFLVIGVNEVPVITTPVSDMTLCRSSGTVTLSPDPLGGTWSGDIAVTKNTNGTFSIDKSTLTAGTHSLVYSIHNSACTATATTVITVSPPPSIPLSNREVCIGSGDITVTLPYPGHFTSSDILYSSGTISGDERTYNISSTADHIYEPLINGHAYSLTYETTVGGCYNTKSVTFTTYAPADLSLPCTEISVCSTSSTVSLGSATTWTILSGPSGAALAGNFLNYSLSGAGDYSLLGEGPHCSSSLLKVHVIDCSTISYGGTLTNLLSYGCTSSSTPPTTGGTSPWTVSGGVYTLTAAKSPYHLTGPLYLNVSGSNNKYNIEEGVKIFIDGPDGSCPDVDGGSYSIHVEPGAALTVAPGCSLMPYLDHHVWGGIISHPEATMPLNAKITLDASNQANDYNPILINGSMLGVGYPYNGDFSATLGPVICIQTVFQSCFRGIYTGNSVVSGSTVYKPLISGCEFHPGWGGGGDDGYFYPVYNSDYFVTLGEGSIVSEQNIMYYGISETGVNTGYKTVPGASGTVNLVSTADQIASCEVGLDLTNTHLTVYGPTAFGTRTIGGNTAAINMQTGSMSLHEATIDGNLSSINAYGILSDFSATNCEIAANGPALTYDAGGSVTLDHTYLFTDQGTCVTMYSGSLTVSGCYISGTASAVLASYLDDVVIEKCSNGYASYYATPELVSGADGPGIDLYECPSVTITQNTISAPTCISVLGDGTTTITANTLNIGEVGIKIINNVWGSGETQNLTLNCNVFTPDPAATTAYGLYVSGTYTKVNDIGGDGNSTIPNPNPGGNIWPITTSSRSNTFSQYSDPTQWFSPSGWYSIYNAGAPGFKYYAYDNEYLGNNYGSVNIPDNLHINAATNYNIQLICGSLTPCTDFFNRGYHVVCSDILSDDTQYYGNLRVTPKNEGPDYLLGTVSKSSAQLLGELVPNPAKDETSIEYQLPDGVGRAVLMVFEGSTGRKLVDYALSGTTGKQVINTSDLPPGFYSVKLIIEGANLASKKLVVIK